MTPIAFRFGPWSVRWYGIFYVLALLAGLIILYWETDRKGLELDPEDLIDFVLLAFPLGLLGARLYYVLFYFDQFIGDPLVFFGFGDGAEFGLSGLALHGGLAGGLIALVVFVRVKRVDFWEFSDALAPGLLLGQAIGRVGNLLNGDAHGFPTDLPWGIVFPEGTRAGTQFPGQPLHPTMLYEFTINVFIFLLLWSWRKERYKKGFIASSYIILYSIGRSLVSFFRAGSLWVGPIRASHLLSIFLVFGVGYFVVRRKLYQKEQS